MKLDSTRKQLRKILMLSLSAGVLFAQQAMAETKPMKKISVANANPREEEPAKKKGKTAKNFASLNNNTVKIYPDALKRDMHVVAKDNDGRLVDFFVFDVQGTLM